MCFLRAGFITSIKISGPNVTWQVIYRHANSHISCRWIHSRLLMIFNPRKERDWGRNPEGNLIFVIYRSLSFWIFKSLTNIYLCLVCITKWIYVQKLNNILEKLFDTFVSYLTVLQWLLWVWISFLLPGFMCFILTLCGLFKRMGLVEGC